MADRAGERTRKKSSLGGAFGPFFHRAKIGNLFLPAICHKAPMNHVLIIHEVADYPAWKKVFDGAAGIRREAGERSYQVLKYHDDANRIVHFSVWTSTADARRFFESPELVKIRAEAGVKAPEFIYLDELEAGTL
jgi:quinol monooxygenase YgiN